MRRKQSVVGAVPIPAAEELPPPIPEIVQEPEKPYSILMWRGSIVTYQCKQCPFDTMDLVRMVEHYDQAHVVREAPIPVTHADPADIERLRARRDRRIRR